MVVNLGARFVVYDPAGSRRGELPHPMAAQMVDVFNDIGSGSLDYHIDAPHSKLLDSMCEIAVEVNNGSGNGTTWVEPGARLLWLKRGTSQVDELRTRRYTLQSYGFQLGKMRMLREELLNENGERLFESMTAGAIVKTLFDETKARGNVPSFSYDFTATHDSAGQPWGGMVPPVSQRYGDTLLDLLRQFADNGICDWRIVGRTLKMYKPDGLGTNRASSVRLLNGFDVIEAPDDQDATELAGRIGVQGDEGRTYEAVSPSSGSWGLWEEMVNASGVKDIGGLQFIGEAEQRRRSAPRVQMTRKLRTHGVVYLPFFAYNVGDTITAPDDSGALAALRVRELQLHLAPDGLSVNATLNDRILERDIKDRRNWQGMLGGASSSSGGTGSPSGPNDDKRKPAAPTGLVVTSVHQFTPEGAPFAVIDAAFTPVSNGADGKPIGVEKHELWVRRDLLSDPWRLLTESAGAESRITYSPMNADEKLQFKLRAISRAGVPGDFSSVVSLTTGRDTTPPPQPAPFSTPQTRLGQIILPWSGLDKDGVVQPVDWSHGIVWMATSATGAGESIGRIDGSGTFVVPMQPYNQTRWFWVRSVDTSGNTSAPSTRVSAITQPLVNTDLIGREIDGANLKLNSIGDDVLTAPLRTAIASADGKTTNYYQASPPAGVGFKVGDTWFETDSDNKIHRWDGSAWVATKLGTDAIANASITNALIADATIQAAKIGSVDAGKIVVGTIDAARIGAKTIGVEKLIVGNFSNLVVDPKFNLPLGEAWMPTEGSGALIQSTSQGPTLRLAAALTTRRVRNSARIDVNPGEDYEISGLVQNGTNASAYISLSWWKANGAYIGNVNLVVPSGVNGWNQFSRLATAPNDVGLAYATFDFYMNSGATDGFAYLTNPRCMKAVGAELLVDGAVIADKIATNAVTSAKIAALAVEAGKIAANAITTDKVDAGAITGVKIAGNTITGDKIQAQSITSEKIVVTGEGNAIDDPKFTLPLGSAWQIASNSVGSWSTIDTSGGPGMALRFFPSSTSGQGIVRNSRRFAVMPGEEYHASARIQNSTDADMLMRVWWTDEAGGTISRSDIRALPGSGWTDYSLIAVAPATAAFARVEIVSSGTASTGTAWVTKPFLGRRVSGELIVDGAIVADKIASNAITAGKIATNAVTADKIAANAITAAKLHADAITGKTITGGTINGTVINGVQINTDDGLTITPGGSIKFQGNTTSGIQTTTVKADSTGLYVDKNLTMSAGTTLKGANLDMSGNVEGSTVRSTYRVQASASNYLASAGTNQLTSTAIDLGFTSSSANVYSSGNSTAMARTSSMRKLKLDREPITADYRILDLPPMTWRDRAEVEANPDTKKRVAGFVAEDLATLTAFTDNAFDALLVTDDEGRATGINYDRVPAYLIPLISDMHERLIAAETQLAELAA